MTVKNLDSNKWFQFTYKAGLAVKGFDGLVELFVGLALLFTPGILHGILSATGASMSHHHDSLHHFVADYIARLDDDLARSGLAFLTLFLIGHGVLKLVLVYCLLRNIVHAYPYVLAALGAFLLYQFYVLAQDVTAIGMWLFTIFDIVIFVLVSLEYKSLKKVSQDTL
ncbi:DUF2127 domain-containing protein [Candidatus Saccharibacteria bacterium]|nr:DUF2127 domain-containing protein [Candidatus Saccharibacteria bacterium]